MVSNIFDFTSTWGNDPNWLILFKGVDWNHQLGKGVDCLDLLGVFFWLYHGKSTLNSIRDNMLFASSSIQQANPRKTCRKRRCTFRETELSSDHRAPPRVSFAVYGCFQKKGTPKSSILIRFSIISHPFWGTPIFGNIHIGDSLGYYPVICRNL